MLLFNADGSRAEMSGNGIRCLAQAGRHARGVRRTRPSGSPPTPASGAVEVPAAAGPP